MGKVIEPWFITNPLLLAETQQLIESSYPTLHVMVQEGVVCISGSLFLYEPNTREEIDRYSIEIELIHNHPKSLPLVRETGGRIPKIIERHINLDGTACLFVPEERWKHYPTQATITDFIAGPVSQFFMSQTYFEATGEWLFGQRKHGLSGLLEFYFEIIGTTNTEVIRNFVDYLSKDKIKGHWPCYCGNQRRLRHCHLKKLYEYRFKIPIEIAKNSLKIMETIKHKHEKI